MGSSDKRRLVASWVAGFYLAAPGNERNSQSEASRVTESDPFRKILVGADISDSTSRILKSSSYLSRVLDATVIVCSVMNIATSVKVSSMVSKRVDQLHESSGSKGKAAREPVVSAVKS